MTVVVRNRCRFLAILFFIGCRLLSHGQLSTQFSSTPQSGCSPLIVSFKDESTGGPMQWRWDLGNGVTSLLQHPSTTYFNPGNYAVKLVIRNAAGNADSLTKTNYITVFAGPTAAFASDKQAGCVPMMVNFSDGSTPGSGTITNWFWDFGDGTTSTQQNPSHVYTTAGNYTVTLRVTNSSGCTKTVTRPQYITASSSVKADFSYTTSGLCAAPATVNFVNSTTAGSPLNFYWNFGDGNTSTASNPAHTYAANGVYSVALIAVSTQGCTDTILKKDVISIGNIKAAFTTADTVCVNDSLFIKNTSSSIPVSSFWNFGNGTTANSTDGRTVYTSAGTYTIKLVGDFGGCKDSITKEVTVIERPQPKFDASQKIFCKLPATVNFTNQTTGGGIAIWDFGDGTGSTLDNPTHTYNTAGSYTVTLTIRNRNGCMESTTVNNFIVIDTPRLSIHNLPRTGCAPITIQPTVTVQSNHTIAGYLWKFGDGTTSTSATPTHQYTNPGSYHVTLVYTTSTGCTDSIVMVNAVRAGTKPSAAFTINPILACALQPVSFTDNSNGGVDQWLWSFGDGGSSTLQNPGYQYSDTGSFHVQLIVFNNTCPDTLRKLNAVYIKPPIAVFAVQNNCTDKYTKVFTDASIGATSWAWDFGDGSSSTQKNNTHTYTKAGAYQVTLTVKNDNCTNTYTRTVFVIDEKAAFTSVDTVICRNQSVSFSPVGINHPNISSWHWNFGDGSFSASDSIASHAYTAAGNYSPSLTITDLFGCTNQATIPIKIYGPKANFSSSTGISCLPGNLITFNDLSTGDGTHPIVKWEWAFGDGAKDSSGNSPIKYSYSAVGNYEVSLLVKDESGCSDWVAKPAAVIISQPDADFFSADTITCTGRAINFTNTSVGTNLQYAWSFGDGNTSGSSNPIHSYGAIGTYPIQLIVTDQYGCKDSLYRNNYISISYPKARFTISDSVSSCPPLLVNFAHQSSDYTSLVWDFGDGTISTLDSPSHFYTTAGIYYPTLTVRGPGGCTDVATKRIEIKGPSGSFTYTPLSGCKPLTVNFVGTAKNNVTYTWDFSDGTIIVTADSIISHTYTNAGEFLPKLILTDAGGCSVPITGTEVVKVNGITSGFTMATAAFCDNGTVQFTNTTVSNDFITGYEWNFGDGKTSTTQHPSHHYTAPGVYSVSLLVTSQNGCRDSVRLTDTVKVYANPVIAINHDPSGCVPVTVRFSGVTISGDPQKLAWSWNFGNNQTDSLQMPSTQVYSLPKAYNVTAIATDDHGCKDTASTDIDAYPVPAVNAGANVFVCDGSFTQLTATGAATYSWKADPTLSCTSCTSPLAAPADTTTYFVTGTSQYGCVASDSVTVGVYPRFTLEVGVGDTVCSGATVHLKAMGTDRYTWTPSVAVVNPNLGITTANPTATTTYQVIAADKYNCFTDTGYVHIKVWPYPTVNAGADKTVPIGSTVNLQPIYSNDIISYRWTNPMQSLSCVDCPSPTVQTKAAKNIYSIRVENEGGCVTTDDITIFAICNGSNLFFPNTFSPNNDGKNERFYPRGSGLSKIKALRIYNRWGEIVFTATNFDANDAAAGWDGTFKGQPLPPDVYVYTYEVVCVNNEILSSNGNVTLLK